MSFAVLSSPLESLQTDSRPFFQDSYATIVLDDSIPCIKMTLTGVPRYSEHYHEVQSKRLELMHREVRNYPKLHMLTDSSTAGPVLDEDVAHFRLHVLPEMERAGIRYLAIVMPASKFAQLSIREMTQNTRMMTVKYFEAMRDAKIWLRRMTNA